MSSSCRVSMCSLTKAIGTTTNVFLPCLTYDLNASSVKGPSQGNGPTLDCHTNWYGLQKPSSCITN